MKGLWAKVAVAVMVVLLSSGCFSTFSEIRSKELFYTITSTKTPQDVSKCIEYKIRASTGLTVNREEYENNTYRIAVSFSGAVGAAAFADILVKPQDNGSVVEIRKSALVNPSYYQETVERCAK